MTNAIKKRLIAEINFFRFILKNAWGRLAPVLSNFFNSWSYSKSRQIYFSGRKEYNASVFQFNTPAASIIMGNNTMIVINDRNKIISFFFNSKIDIFNMFN